MNQLIDFSKGHSTVIGITGSGKSYSTNKSLANAKQGVLYFNTTHTDKACLGHFTKASGDNRIEQIISSLRHGKKINFLPPEDEQRRNMILTYLIDKLYLAGFTEENFVYIAVDEVHLYKKESLQSMIKVATTGRVKGVKGIWISQRPANIDNTLMTQSEQFIIFKTNMENNYLKNYNIPIEEIQNKIKEPHEYCVYDFKELKGPFKV